MEKRAIENSLNFICSWGLYKVKYNFFFFFAIFRSFWEQLPILMSATSLESFAQILGVFFPQFILSLKLGCNWDGKPLFLEDPVYGCRKLIPNLSIPFFIQRRTIFLKSNTSRKPNLAFSIPITKDELDQFCFSGKMNLYYLRNMGIMFLGESYSLGTYENYLIGGGIKYDQIHNYLINWFSKIHHFKKHGNACKEDQNPQNPDDVFGTIFKSCNRILNYGYPNWGIISSIRTFVHPPVAIYILNLDHNNMMKNDIQKFLLVEMLEPLVQNLIGLNMFGTYISSNKNDLMINGKLFHHDINCYHSQKLNAQHIISHKKTITRAVTMALACKCFHITFLNKLMKLVVTCVDIINNQPDVLPNSSCYNPSNMKKSSFHLVNKSYIYFAHPIFLEIIFEFQMTVKDHKEDELWTPFYDLDIIFLCYDHIENVDKSLAKSKGLINPDNPNHRSLKKPTKLSQTKKIWSEAWISTNLMVHFMILLQWKSQNKKIKPCLEGQKNILCKPIIYFSSMEDEPLLLPLSLKPFFKSLKATVLSFCVCVFFNDREDKPLPKAGILLTALSTMFSAESKHDLNHQIYFFTWIFLKAL
ncbi:hypothetical protein VP01_3966g2 [Puccinia sorghi]|uniref:Uncharacterized protein n=1 Tax=Puccinia sorghi TaxID=27349 RepID=A0A0L6USA5_9BASI|nr:hypothetical protein VP01_3966g2 [Puccinia sorghi]